MTWRCRRSLGSDTVSSPFWNFLVRSGNHLEANRFVVEVLKALTPRLADSQSNLKPLAASALAEVASSVGPDAAIKVRRGAFNIYLVRNSKSPILFLDAARRQGNLIIDVTTQTLYKGHQAMRTKPVRNENFQVFIGPKVFIKS